MRSSAVDLTLVGLAAIGLSVGTWRWRGAAIEDTAPELPQPLAPASAFEGTEADDTRALISRNLFRLSGRPARPRLGEEPVPEPSTAARYRPALVLKGIIGGPPWTAMVHGIPGRRGSVLLSEGERADSLLVRSISADRIVLVGPDTTWILTLGRDRP